MENLDGTIGVVEGEDGNLLTTALSCFSESLWTGGFSLWVPPEGLVP